MATTRGISDSKYEVKEPIMTVDSLRWNFRQLDMHFICLRERENRRLLK